jgi:hypothetical protein
MRTRDYVIMFLGLTAGVGLLYAAGAQLDYINAQREVMKIVINPALENAPPSLAFATVAMGAFRGLVVDILWMRADKLKEEGQFFDARQLAEWITKLQPRFAAVWEFHAWNMAYNISVAIPATQPEQRWKWVKNGYELLRDEGIPLNPKSVGLYQELARIFQHKMGGVTDDAQEYYKLQFAEEIGPLLESADNGLRRDDNRYLEALIRAPTDWVQIAADPNVAPLLQALRAADRSFTDDAEFVKSYLALRQEEAQRQAEQAHPDPESPADAGSPSKFKPAAFQVLDTYRQSAALKRFDLFAKAYQLRHVWKLDPVRMQQVAQRYGPVDFQDPNQHLPLDWRHPDSHAMYWALKGLEIAKQDKDREIAGEEVNTDRMVLHCLQDLFRYGKIMIVQGWEPRPDAQDLSEKGKAVYRKDIFLGPDPRIFESYEKAYRVVYEKYEINRGREESFANGHRNMLKNAVLVFYQAGLKTEAAKILARLRRDYKFDEFKVSLDQFARNRILEELDGLGITDASEAIASSLFRAYAAYAAGDDDTAAATEQLAEQVWDIYKAKYGDNVRIDLPPTRVLKWYALNEFLTSNAYPLYLQQRLLDRIQREKPSLYKELQQGGEEVRQRLEQEQKTQKQ